METLLVLTNPQQTFKGPAATVGAVSWEAARQLLRDPARLLLTLERVDIERIPMHNLRALVKYVEHPAWPDLGKLQRPGTSSGAKSPNRGAPKKRSQVAARGDKNETGALRRKMIKEGSLAPPDQTEADEDEEVLSLIHI